ncbi:hypothetical protein [Bacteroides salyersiae]|uniref:hypothetical protein n=1 Tax=Bacteroides salyersiae TaxID=291644 RepID=UPI00129C228D|nr:hypothetical protein [Bacteroides salyersiae]
MSYRIVRTSEEIDELLNQCSESEETGHAHFPSMSYEQGVKAAIEWLCGYVNDHPINE